MNKLLSVLIAAAFVSPVFAADAPKAEVKPEAKAAAASGQAVTPQEMAATMKQDIQNMRKSAAKPAAAAKPADAPKPIEAAKPEAQK